MKVEVESLDSVRKNIEVVLDESKVNELREGIYQDLKKHAKIKGFRPGKVPRSIIQTYYKDYIEDELKRKMVEETMGDALSETKVEPVSEPRVEFLEDEGRFGYKMECEVVPEFETPPYKGIEVEAEKIDVTEEDIAKRLESMQQMHTQLMDREGDQPAQKGDFVIVKYEASHDGKPVKGVKAESYPLDLGSANLTPEFENGIVGMKVGEEKEIAIPFAADYPDKDVAGKTLLFKVELKEIKEKKLPELNDDFAKDLSFENMDQLRAEVKKGLETEKEGQRKNIIAEQIVNSLLEKSDFPVPARMAQKRAEMLVEDARSRMKVGTLSDEEDRSLNTALLKEYEPEAQKRIKMGLILAKIAEQEGLKVEDSEVDERLQRIAEETKRAYDYIREFYEKYNLRGNLKTSMLEEKTMNLLIENAAVKEKQ
ncbi:MAG: Trigger factor [Syntrophorhabdaceae bacterium PtaU1.Bin034]|nr:MAG: Trigger factor [Syntrophorhabdaceae bacterium PtaU1.Bin034]